MNELVTQAMDVEWRAWRRTSEALAELGLDDWDNPKVAKLHAVVLLWSECLVALRMLQTPEIRAKAIDEATTMAYKAFT